MQVIFIQKEERVSLTLPLGSTGLTLAKELNFNGPDQALALVREGQILDLSTLLAEGDELSLLSFADKQGKEVFWHTSTHLLAQAVLRLFPKALPTIGPATSEGFYYDFANLSIQESDLESIEREMQKIVKEDWALKRLCFTSKAEALETFKTNPFKREILERIEGECTAYSQGEFLDLCRGPHLPDLKKIRALKLTKISGAYWRADASNVQLQRIYGISFPEKNQLKNYLHRLEEAKQRDHKRLGPQLQLFVFREEAPGMPFLLPKGLRIWEALLKLWREFHQQAGYIEIRTPTLLTRNLWERSGHWEHYRDNMYAFEVERRDFALKPMNCPGCMLYYSLYSHSYRELPLRIAEIGQVFRNEPSGALSGLMRVRSFHQDDAHIFALPEQIEGEVVALLSLIKQIYEIFGLRYRLELSTRPKDKSIGTEEQWNYTTHALEEALRSWGRSYERREGQGAFYGPKIDVHVEDALQREWQCGTIQLDLALPKRFGVTYTNEQAEKKEPIVLHRAIYGSIERFLAILIEHFKGRLPLWISPLHCIVLPVADRHLNYAQRVNSRLKASGFFCKVDDSNHSIRKKVREAQLQQVNYMVILGDRELEEGKLSLRTRNNVLFGEREIEEFIDLLKREREERLLHSPYEIDSSREGARKG